MQQWGWLNAQNKPWQVTIGRAFLTNNESALKFKADFLLIQIKYIPNITLSLVPS
jgi:hypothetical protein